MRHVVIVIDRTKTEGSTLVEQCGCGEFMSCALTTYKTLCEEYKHEIEACTHHVELICNNDHDESKQRKQREALALFRQACNAHDEDSMMTDPEANR